MATHSSVSVISELIDTIVLIPVTGCWITEQYPVQRIVLEYMWMWITAFLNFVLYALIAFVLFTDRTAVVSGWRVRFMKNADTGQAVPGWEKRLALKMLV